MKIVITIIIHTLPLRLGFARCDETVAAQYVKRKRIAFLIKLAQYAYTTHTPLSSLVL